MLYRPTAKSHSDSEPQLFPRQSSAGSTDVSQAPPRPEPIPKKEVSERLSHTPLISWKWTGIFSVVGTALLYIAQQAGSTICEILADMLSLFGLGGWLPGNSDASAGAGSLLSAFSFFSLSDLEIYEMFALSFVTTVTLSVLASIIYFTPWRRQPSVSQEKPRAEQVTTISGYFAQRITSEEFDRQAGEFTAAQIRLLQQTPEYKSALQRKGSSH